ncbi:hypothetical protein ECHOSC_0591 [Ehrlichia chaffeensis str. Osceola]|nr:hypothetical protein ECHJAX_0475 [Ehrlichia chaffeensis str. Jax]AHX07824.1 hypothetical protein ECHOSC_0591 [Ehrlichia chaffeensis str. Osceola]AHX08952.1 hypothetical protein ECHSTV_0464 [Ehrlichia chaffeensis str. Saint Vincent]
MFAVVRSFCHSNINIVFDVLYIPDLVLRKQFIYVFIGRFCITI